MTQLAYAQFCSLIAGLADTLTTRETIATIRERHKKQLAEITPQIVENAIINIRRNVLRRKAKFFVEGIGDLFEAYDIPAKLPRPGLGNSKAKVSPNKLTKKELWLLIQEYKHRPPKKDRHLAHLEKMHSDIEAYCSDDETVEIGLKRLKSK